LPAPKTLVRRPLWGNRSFCQVPSPRDGSNQQLLVLSASVPAHLGRRSLSKLNFIMFFGTNPQNFLAVVFPQNTKSLYNTRGPKVAASFRATEFNTTRRLFRAFEFANRKEPVGPKNRYWAWMIKLGCCAYCQFGLQGAGRPPTRRQHKRRLTSKGSFKIAVKCFL
jgi:hypothetical protein